MLALEPRDVKLVLAGTAEYTGDLSDGHLPLCRKGTTERPSPGATEPDESSY